MRDITVYLLSFNESYLLPQVDKWWKDRFKNVKFVLYDNESTDNTVELAKERGWEVRNFHTEGMSDLIQMNLKNECWKDCNTTWAWVSDFDELPGFAEESFDNFQDYAIIRLNGWEFIDAVYTIQEAKYGIQTDGYSKATLLQPSKMKETGYEAGAHKFKPVVKEGKIGEKLLDLYHMKWFSPTHAINRALLLGNRQSEDNKRRKWSFHFSLPLEQHLDYYKTHFKNRIKII